MQQLAPFISVSLRGDDAALGMRRGTELPSLSVAQGATLINGARGGHMVEADVLAALDEGQVTSSSLMDVWGSSEAYPDALHAHNAAECCMLVHGMPMPMCACCDILISWLCCYQERRYLILSWSPGDGCLREESRAGCSSGTSSQT